MAILTDDDLNELIGGQPPAAPAASPSVLTDADVDAFLAEPMSDEDARARLRRELERPPAAMPDGMVRQDTAPMGLVNNPKARDDVQRQLEFSNAGVKGAAAGLGNLIPYARFGITSPEETAVGDMPGEIPFVTKPARWIGELPTYMAELAPVAAGGPAAIGAGMAGQSYAGQVERERLKRETEQRMTKDANLGRGLRDEELPIPPPMPVMEAVGNVVTNPMSHVVAATSGLVGGATAKISGVWAKQFADAFRKYSAATTGDVAGGRMASALEAVSKDTGIPLEAIGADPAAMAALREAAPNAAIKLAAMMRANAAKYAGADMGVNLAGGNIMAASEAAKAGVDAYRAGKGDEALRDAWETFKQSVGPNIVMAAAGGAMGAPRHLGEVGKGFAADFDAALRAKFKEATGFDPPAPVEPNAPGEAVPGSTPTELPLRNPSSRELGDIARQAALDAGESDQAADRVATDARLAHKAITMERVAQAYAEAQASGKPPVLPSEMRSALAEYPATLQLFEQYGGTFAERPSEPVAGVSPEGGGIVPPVGETVVEGGSGLTAEAQGLLSQAEGGVPAFVSGNMARIARENGVDPTGMTPQAVIEALRARVGEPIPPDPNAAPVARRIDDAVAAGKAHIGRAGEYIHPADNETAKQAVRYAVMEADTITPSHDPLANFARTSQVNARLQDRDYAGNKAEQRKVMDNAANLNPRLVVNDALRADDAPPLVQESTGDVLSGNSRVMSILMAAGRFPEKYEGYRQYLADNAARFGLDPNAIRAMKRPVFVRLVEPGAEGAEVFATKANATVGRQLSTNELARTLSGKLQQHDPGAMKALLAAADGDKLGEILTDPQTQKRFTEGMESLLGANVASQFSEQGRLTESGKSLLKQMLYFTVIGDNDLATFLINESRGLRQKVEMSLAQIAQVQKLPVDFRIGKALRAALKLMVERPEARSLDQLIGQADFTEGGEPPKVGPKVRAIASMLLDSHASRLREGLKEYLDRAGGGVQDAFSEARTPGELLTEIARPGVPVESKPEGPRAGVISNDPTLKLVGTAKMGPARGSRYLEVERGKEGVLKAVRWRKKPVDGALVIDMKPEAAKGEPAGVAAGPGEEVAYMRRTKPAPRETVTAYKLFRVDPRRPGELFPLFVRANEAVPIGEWLDADTGELTAAGKVKSKLGPVAFRPGWHGGDLPVAKHIGEKSQQALSAPDRRAANHVWAEVEFAADRDWQAEANRRAKVGKNGQPVAATAQISDQIPEDGYYRYKTNPNMQGNWLIGGAMRVRRVLSDAEVAAINSKAGVSDLPRVSPLDLKRLGFSEGEETADLKMGILLGRGVDEKAHGEWVKYRKKTYAAYDDYEWRAEVRKRLATTERANEPLPRTEDIYWGEDRDGFIALPEYIDADGVAHGTETKDTSVRGGYGWHTAKHSEETAAMAKTPTSARVTERDLPPEDRQFPLYDLGGGRMGTADALLQAKLGVTAVSGIKPPELHMFAKKLGVDFDVKALAEALGRSRLSEARRLVELGRESGDSYLLGAVAGHEIGHVIGWLAKHTLKMGGIVGHIAGTPFVKGVARQLGTSTRELRSELKTLSRMWHPFDPEADTKFTSYRYSAAELYADGLSVLLNNPGLAEEVAPSFYSAFFRTLDARPEVRDAYAEVQRLLNRPEEEILAAREERLAAPMAHGAILRAASADARTGRNRWAIWKDWTRVAAQHLYSVAAPGLKRSNEMGVNSDPNGVRARWMEMQYDTDSFKAFFRFGDKVLGVLKDAGFDDGMDGENSAMRALGVEMFGSRVEQGDRADMVNPQLFTAETAGETREAMAKRIGPEKYKAVKQAAQELRDVLSEWLEKGYEAGMYSEDFIKTVRKNKETYATFSMVKFSEDGPITARDFPMYGTVSDAENPALATFLKTLTVIRAVKKQEMVASFRDLLKLTGEIEDAKLEAAGRDAVGTQKLDWAPVKDGDAVLKVWEEGKMKAYSVPAEVVQFTQNMHPVLKGVAGSVAAFIGMYDAAYGKKLFTTWNPAFRLWFNPIRDMKNAYIYSPVMDPIRFGAAAWRALGVASAAAGDSPHMPAPKSARKARNQARARELTWEKKVLPPRGKMAWADLGGEDKTVEQRAIEAALGEDTPSRKLADERIAADRAKRGVDGGRAAIKKFFDPVMHNRVTKVTGEATKAVAAALGVAKIARVTAHLFNHTGDTFELWGKSTAAELIEPMGDTKGTFAPLPYTGPAPKTRRAGFDFSTEAGRREAIMRLAGTPLFSEMGEWSPITNNMFMFSNVRAHGFFDQIRALKRKGVTYDIAHPEQLSAWDRTSLRLPLAKLGTTRTGRLIKIAMVDFFPKMITRMLPSILAEMGEPEAAKWWRDWEKNLPEYERANFQSIPVLPMVPGFESWRIRFPMSEVGQTLSSFLDKAMEGEDLGAGDRLVQASMAAVQSGASQTPTAATMAKIPIKIIEYLRGYNPEDWGGRQIIDPLAFKGRKATGKVGAEARAAANKQMAWWVLNSLGPTSAWDPVKQFGRIFRSDKRAEDEAYWKQAEQAASQQAAQSYANRQDEKATLGKSLTGKIRNVVGGARTEKTLGRRMDKAGLNAADRAQAERLMQLRAERAKREAERRKEAERFGSLQFMRR